jgi:hypothetical protein
MTATDRRAVVVVVALVALAGVTPFALVGTAAAATITVDESGGADYTTIQAAVDAARQGDTIQVAPGTYSESVLIDKRLTLVGDTGDGSVGAGEDAPVLAGGESGYAFAVTHEADGTTIKGFEFGGANTNALLITVNDGEILSEFTFRHNDVAGSHVRFDLKSGTVRLEDAVVSNNRLGSSSRVDVNGDDPADLIISALDIVDNEITKSSSDAIDVDLEAGMVDATLTVSRNTITDAEDDGIEFELDSQDTYDLIVEANRIDGADDVGIQFLDNGGSGMTARVENNDIRNVRGPAMDVDDDGDASKIRVRRNNFVGNGGGINSHESGPAQVIDARDNYWGASDGPSSASGTLADPVDTDVLANGSGDYVSGTLTTGDSLSNVRFAPFATEPFTIGSEPEADTASDGADIEIGDATFSSTNPVVGERVSISIPVTNEGDATGTLYGMLRSDFTPHENVDLVIEPDETTVVRGTVIYEDAEQYNVYFADEYVGTVDVGTRDPMNVTVEADPANNTVDATVENPRRTAIDIPIPPVNATTDSGVVLTNVVVTPATVDDFQLGITQSAPDTENATATNDTNASAAMLPDGTAPVSAISFDSSLANDHIESVQLTFTVDVTRYPSLADAAVGDSISLYRYDASTDTYTQMPSEVVEAGNGSITATVTLDGFSTYLLGVDRAAFDVHSSVAGNPVAAGDTLALELGVTNTGDGVGMYAPDVSVAGEPVEAGSLVLAAGASDTLVVEVPASAVGVWPITIDGKLAAIAFVEPADDEN